MMSGPSNPRRMPSPEPMEGQCMIGGPPWRALPMAPMAGMGPLGGRTRGGMSGMTWRTPPCYAEIPFEIFTTRGMTP